MTPIADAHLAILQTLTGIRPGEELPDALVSGYWDMKRCYDRVSAYFTERELATLAWMQGYGAPRSADQTNLRIKFRGGEVEYGYPIEIKWRNEWKTGKLLGDVQGDKRKLRVSLDEDGVERTVDLLLTREVELAGV
jgi:hypothetical protein